MIDASNGASDYGNKFGEPLIQVSATAEITQTPFIDIRGFMLLNVLLVDRDTPGLLACGLSMASGGSG